MANVGTLTAKIVAHTGKFTAGMKTAGKSVRGFQGKTAAASKGVGLLSGAMGAVGVAGFVAGFTKAARAVETFNREMNASLAIVGDVSKGVKRQMKTVAHDVAIDTKYFANEAAKGYYYLASAGLDVEQQMKSLPVAAKFAMAGNFDLARATDILTDSQSALGLASKDANKHMMGMKRVGNVVVAAASKANASVEQFGESLMNKGALGAKLVNMELEEAMATLMVYADKGFAKGAEGGQALWMALRDLKTKAVENQAAFERLGIRVDAGGGKFAKMADIVSDLDRAFAGLEPLEAQKKLSALGLPSKSLAPIQSLLGTADQLRKYEKYLLNIGDTMEEVAGRQLTPFQKSWHKLSATISKLTEPTLTEWLDSMGESLGKLVPHVNEVGKALDRLGKSQLRNLNLHKVVYEAMNTKIPGPNLLNLDPPKRQGVGTHVEELQKGKGLDAKRQALLATIAAQDALDAKSPGSLPILDNVKAQVKLTDSTAEYATKLKQANDYLGELRRDYSTFGMDARQQKLFDLSQMGVDASVLGEIEAWTARLRDAERQQEQLRAATDKTAEAALNLASATKDIQLSIETPVEKMERLWKDLEDVYLAKGSTLTGGEFDRRLAQIQQEYRDETKGTSPTFTPAAAMERGSQAAYSTIVKNMMGGMRNPQVDLLKEGNRQRGTLIDQGRDRADEPDTVVIGP